MAEDERNPVLLTDEVRTLLALIKDTDIAEVLIERGDAKLHIKRAFAQPVMPAAPTYVAAPMPTVATVVAPNGSVSVPAALEQPEAADNSLTITAPMVGTFYATSAPKEPPYVQVGDEVKPGDILGIIEAMKIMNEIECEVHGRVTQILVPNAQPVEYGQALMIIEPI